MSKMDKLTLGVNTVQTVIFYDYCQGNHPTENCQVFFFAEQEEALYANSHSSSGSDSDSDNDDNEEEEEEDDDDGEVEIIGSSSSIADRVREEKEEEERMSRASKATAASGSTSGKGKENESEGEWDREGVEGLFCPICMEAWSNEGAHNPRFDFSLFRDLCPQCKKKCTLKDVRRMYGSRVVVIDEQSNKRIRFLEAKCDAFKKKVRVVAMWLVIDTIPLASVGVDLYAAMSAVHRSVAQAQKRARDPVMENIIRISLVMELRRSGATQLPIIVVFFLS
ncbi:hypothetical protein Drorol1_Dr00015139 [Drosera rotundifolia]